MPKIITLGVETACEYTFKLRLYLKCFLMVIFNSKNGAVCTSPSNIMMILDCFYSQLDEKVWWGEVDKFKFLEAIVFSACSNQESCVCEPKQANFSVKFMVF